MNQTIPFPIAVLLVAIPLAGIFIWAHIEVKKDEEKFKLENSRQFIMKFSTAKDHSLLEAENGYVTMVYGKKRYKYKIIRIVGKKYKHIHNYSANYYTVHYFVFEKISDEQPPHYYEMKMMKEKEDQRKMSFLSLRKKERKKRKQRMRKTFFLQPFFWNGLKWLNTPYPHQPTAAIPTL